jgi:hypothetical protein
MGGFSIDPNPTNGDAGPQKGTGHHDRQEWIRANFTQIFGTSAAELRARGIDPREYAREHRDQVRRFAQLQRSQGIAVPTGRPAFDRGPGNGGPSAGMPNRRGYGYGGGSRLGMGMRGGSAWIGILIVLLALRFLLVDSFVGAHAAILWVLMIGGIMLVARVFFFSWLRRRRFNRNRPG